MSESDNVRIVKGIYTAFERGHVAGVLDALADDVDWKVPQASSVDWSKCRSGREEVRQFPEEMNGDEQPESVVLHDYIAQDDKVVAIGTWRASSVATGRMWETDFAHFFTIRDRKVQKIHNIYDTGVIVEAHRACISENEIMRLTLDRYKSERELRRTRQRDLFRWGTTIQLSLMAAMILISLRPESPTLIVWFVFVALCCITWAIDSQVQQQATVAQHRSDLIQGLYKQMGLSKMPREPASTWWQRTACPRLWSERSSRKRGTPSGGL